MVMEYSSGSVLHSRRLVAVKFDVNMIVIKYPGSPPKKVIMEYRDCDEQIMEMSRVGEALTLLFNMLDFEYQNAVLMVWIQMAKSVKSIGKQVLSLK